MNDLLMILTSVETPSSGESPYVEWLNKILHYFANTVIFLLELVGIIVILIGACRAIHLIFKQVITKGKYNAKISLAHSLQLGLEFKMGAEIIKTVMVTEVSELLILGAIILLRAVLSFIIYWEIKCEQKEQLQELEICKIELATHKNNDSKNDEQV